MVCQHGLLIVWFTHEDYFVSNYSLKNSKTKKNDFQQTQPSFHFPLSYCPNFLINLDIKLISKTHWNLGEINNLIHKLI